MGTRQLDLGCTFRHQAAWPTAALLHVVPAVPSDGGAPAMRRNAGIIFKDEKWSLEPQIEIHPYTDTFGNQIQRFTMPQGVSTVSYSVRAEVPDEIDPADESAPELSPIDLPDETLVYTLASRFCHNDVLSGQAWKLFGGMEPGYQRVAAICDWTWNYLTYTTGSTTFTSTSTDAFLTGRGVCRDFAHLMITMCRALNIPARYAHGYLPDMDVPPLPTPMDFHAWVEVYLGDRWWTFDPRHNARRKGRVLIGVGRDAADVALITTYGAPWLQLMTVTAQEPGLAPM
ncbi:transglutaminase domain-containing protein [Branchiibius cervicis]|uniref:Transglutaminase domain-containing protein n=1 Tax=Branchiibius cervicis TaxID=908252 RepID=A0ABW2AUV6_9MICO